MPTTVVRETIEWAFQLSFADVVQRSRAVGGSARDVCEAGAWWVFGMTRVARNEWTCVTGPARGIRRGEYAWVRTQPWGQQLLTPDQTDVRRAEDPSVRERRAAIGA
jgi:hypothetical protein